MPVHEQLLSSLKMGSKHTDILEISKFNVTKFSSYHGRSLAFAAQRSSHEHYQKRPKYDITSHQSVQDQSGNFCEESRNYSSFLQNEGIFVKLDELDELDKFTHAWIRIHLQFHTDTEDTLVKGLTCLTGPWSSLPIFNNFILSNSSNSTRLMKKLECLTSCRFSG